MADFSFDIVEHIAVLSEANNGWTKELNRVRWSQGNVKYDIRSWDPAHEKMGKGITLDDAEAKALMQALAHRFQ